MGFGGDVFHEFLSFLIESNDLLATDWILRRDNCIQFNKVRYIFTHFPTPPFTPYITP
jgi:hypothetical protein